MENHKLPETFRRRQLRIQHYREREQQKKSRKPHQSFYTVVSTKKHPFKAPADFRLLKNTDECLLFFSKLRASSLDDASPLQTVWISLRAVEKIDYSTVSILTAISEDLKSRKIFVRGNLPRDQNCRQFMIDSGYLNHLYNLRGESFPTSEEADMLFFEKGAGILTREANKRLDDAVKNAVKYLKGKEKYVEEIHTIILEICGNSIEWSDSFAKQWLLGVKYEDDRVIFTVTDVGRGILRTLNRKFSEVFVEEFSSKRPDQILMRAFDISTSPSVS